MRPFPWLVPLMLIPLGSCAFFFGPSSRDAPPMKAAGTSVQLERGRYLVNNVSLCFHCHSRRAFDRFGTPPLPGSLGGGGDCFDEHFAEDFPGKVCMPNITPDRQSGVGTWTDGELARAIREGVDRDGDTLFPMMPYAVYKRMSDDDVLAIIAYLRTVEPKANAVAESDVDFPVSRFVNFAPEPLEGPVPPPDRSDSVAYGEYLTWIAGCVDCHTPRDGHAMDEERLFAGGYTFKANHLAHVNTPNLTPHPETGIGKMSREEFIGRFTSFASADPFAETVDWRRQTVMPWKEYAGMSAEDLGAIYDYLRTVPAIDNKVEVFPEPLDGPKQPVRLPGAP